MYLPGINQILPLSLPTSDSLSHHQAPHLPPVKKGERERGKKMQKYFCIKSLQPSFMLSVILMFLLAYKVLIFSNEKKL